MARHLDLGKQGEELARNYLIENSYEILFQNWRYSHWELDFIASKENLLHFIEVKTRTSDQFGYPEESVDRKKMNNLLEAAESFQHDFPGWKSIQFDILSITVGPNGSCSYFFIEDVYF